ncbi:MAG: hypothetical protein ACRBK7_00785 [Acidimicrobiales bacterium]
MKMKQKRAVAIASIVFGGLALTAGVATPSNALPKTEWNQICDWAGGTYYNTAYGELCVINGHYIWAD